ncbi:MAG: tetratricopeptide repeat protein [Bdellovibrionota bacterium]
MKLHHGVFCLLIITLTQFAQAAKPSVNSMAKQNLIIELTGKDPSKMTDVGLYSELVATYQSNNEIAFKSRLQSFMQNYSKSTYADNALFLAGRMALENKNYPEALRYFHRITVQYPNSNKVVAAQFSKAVAYKKMNLNPQAKKVFTEITRKYPGSPEGFRAQNEIRLIR